MSKAETSEIIEKLANETHDYLIATLILSDILNISIKDILNDIFVLDNEYISTIKTFMALSNASRLKLKDEDINSVDVLKIVEPNMTLNKADIIKVNTYNKFYIIVAIGGETNVILFDNNTKFEQVSIFKSDARRDLEWLRYFYNWIHILPEKIVLLLVQVINELNY